MTEQTMPAAGGDQLVQTQRTALAALTAGGTFPQAAGAAGVNRCTLYRWLQNDPQFRAAYNAWQQELAESARARLLKLTDKAVDVIEHALGRNDEKVAVRLLRHTGMMRGPGRKSTDPEVLGLRMDLRRRREQYDAVEAMAKHLLRKAGLSPAQQKKYLREQAAGRRQAAAKQAGPTAGDDATPDATIDATIGATKGELLHEFEADGDL